MTGPDRLHPTPNSTMVLSESDLRDAWFYRLVLAKGYAGINNAEIARRTRASDSSVSTWFDKRIKAMPEGIKLLQLPWALGVDGHWLLTGEGNMLRDIGDGDHQVQQAKEAIARAELFLKDKRVQLTEAQPGHEHGVERRHENGRKEA